MPATKPRIDISAVAQGDIEDIWRHIAGQNSIAVAENVYSRIRARIQDLADFPESGSPRDHIGVGLRCIPVSSWLIFYRYSAKRSVVQIVRVLHGHMDVERHLR